MRATPTYLLLTTLATLVTPLAAQDTPDETPFFLQKPTSAAEALRAYREKPYRPVRTGEVLAAAFLSEGRELPFGEAVGPTTPPKVRAGGSIAMTQLGAHFAVRPPEGGSYAPGDTLMVAVRLPGPRGWGDIISPTGRVLVESIDAHQVLTRIVDIYGPMRAGQVVLPSHTVVDPREVAPVATAGPAGHLIGPLQVRDLILPGSIVFSDLGQSDGVRVGDFVTVRRESAERVNAADTIDEAIGTAQVVQVGPDHSTLRLIEVMSPQMPAGSPVVRTATLPQ